MAEMRETNAKHAKAGRRRQVTAAREIRNNREQLSRERGHIYEQGTYAPEATGHRRGPLTWAEVQQIKQLRAAGHSILDISCTLDRSMGAVRDACKHHKIPSPRKAQGGWAAKKEKDDDQVHPGNPGRADLLAAHDTGVCGRECRLGRHVYRR